MFTNSKVLHYIIIIFNLFVRSQNIKQLYNKSNITYFNQID